MIFVLIFLFLLLCIEIIVLGLFFSLIVINIENLQMQGINARTNVSSINISVDIYLYRIFKLIKIQFYRNYFKILGIKFYYNKTFKYEDKTQLTKKILKIIKKNKVKIRNIRPEFESFKFNLDFGTEDAAITSLLTPTFSGIIVYLLKKFTKNLNRNNYEFKITPNYLNNNNFNMEFETKIKLKTWDLLKIAE